MDDIGVVPEDAEVGRRGLERGHAAHGLVRVGDARGVGVLGHAPDALDGRIALDEAADLVHVGAVRAHGNGNVLEAGVGRDRKVTVIAGAGAQELERATLRLQHLGLAAAHALDPAVQHDVAHDVQARRSPENHVGDVHAEDVRHEGAGRGQAVGTAVVGRVNTTVREVRGRRESVEHRAGEVNLLGRGLTPRHVQRQALGPEPLDIGLELRDRSVKLLGGHALVGVCHVRLHPPGFTRERARLR